MARVTSAHRKPRRLRKGVGIGAIREMPQLISPAGGQKEASRSRQATVLAIQRGMLQKRKLRCSNDYNQWAVLIRRLMERLAGTASTLINYQQ